MKKALIDKQLKKAPYLTFIYRKNHQGVYLDCNDVFAEMAGLASSDDIIGKTDKELPWGKISSSIKNGEQLSLQGQSVDIEDEPLTLPTYGSVNVSIRFQKWHKENSMIALGTLTDNSHKQYTQKTKKSEDPNKIKDSDFYLSMDIIKSIPGMVYWKDLEGRFIGCNHMVATLANANSPNDIIGKTDDEIHWKNNHKEITVADHSIIKENKTKCFEQEIISSNKKKQIFLSLKSPAHDRNNKIIGLLSISIDITKIKKEQKEIERNRANLLLENIINQVPSNIYWKSREGKILGCNKFVADMANMQSPSDLVGKTDYELPWKINADAYRKVDNEIMNSGITKSFEEEFHHQDGKIEEYLSTKSPLIDINGKIIGIIGTSLNITELKSTQRELEKADAANLAKTNFLSICGHELRTPTSFIIGICTELIRQHKQSKLDSDKIMEFITMFHHSALDLEKHIENILDFSRLEVGQCKVNLKKTNLRDLLNKLYKQTCHRSDRKKLKIHFNYPEKLPDFIFADEARVNQVYQNFINNAFKFTPEDGEINIIVSCSKNQQDGASMLKVTVKDSGIGISPEGLKNIWDRFQQVHSKPTDERPGRYKGLGLGLAIVKELMDLMQGHIDVDSKLGEGSAFSFSLPVFDNQQEILKEKQHDK